MGQRYDALSEKHIRFIAEQKIFFVGTATADSRVNVSPKGMDALRVLGANRVVWLNLTGSGNESAAHVQHAPRMTIMFCSFAEEPLILRLYGTAKAIHRGDTEWAELSRLFPPMPGARQIFDVAIDLVQSSCGFAVPYFDYQGERETLTNWAEKKGEAGIRQYWADKNQQSLDGIPTHVIEKSG
jgi:Pyridoxamine 5'-phosphate oxidase